jgi:hypothetical protein
MTLKYGLENLRRTIGKGIATMLVKELLAKTMEMKLEDVSKEVKIPYLKLKDVLKEKGCQPLGSGKRGWIFNGEDQSILDQSIFTFMDASKSRTRSKNTSKNNSVKNSKVVNNDDSVNSNAINSKKDDVIVSEIKALIQGKNKDDSARVYKGIYFDQDIAKFLDNVQHGNKSEIVNKIMRQYLMDNELM